MNNGGLCRDKAARERSRALTSIMPRLRMSGVIPYCPPYAFMAWTETNLLLLPTDKDVAAKVKTAVPAKPQVPLNCFITTDCFGTYRQFLE